MGKKQDEGGAPAYMGLFTSLMTILLAFFILLSALAPKQQAGFYKGSGMLRNGMGMKGGYGMMNFAKVEGVVGLLTDSDNKKTELGELMKDEDLAGEGGVGTFDNMEPKEIESGNFLVVQVPYRFQRGNSQMPAEMEDYFRAAGPSLLGRKVVLCHVSTEVDDKQEDRATALKRAVSMMRYLKDYAGLSYTDMQTVAYGDAKVLKSKQVQESLANFNQYTCFYFFE